MGSRQSVRASQFHNQEDKSEDISSDPDDVPECHHISISNKMVERLVEDASLVGAASPVKHPSVGSSHAEYQDNILIERLKYLDDFHSERTGLTIKDVNATARRIEIRTSNMVSAEPVCDESREMVVECYAASSKPEDVAKCWEAVGAFAKCAQETAAARLRARRAKEARDTARRTRHVAQAREYALRDLDLGPPAADVPS